MRIRPGWWCGSVGLLLLGVAGCASVKDYFTQPAIIDAASHPNPGTAAAAENSPPATASAPVIPAVAPPAPAQALENQSNSRVLITRIPEGAPAEGPVRPTSAALKTTPAPPVEAHAPVAGAEPITPSAAYAPAVTEDPTNELLKIADPRIEKHQPAPAENPLAIPLPVIAKIEVTEAPRPGDAAAPPPADNLPDLRSESATDPENAHPAPAPAPDHSAETQLTPIPVQYARPMDHTALMPASGADQEAAPAAISPAAAASAAHPGAVNEQAPAANLPAPAGFSMERATAELERQLIREPNNLCLQVALRSLYAAAGMKDKALAPLPIPLDQQATALALARTAVGLDRTAEPDNANQVLEALRQLSEQIAAEADLRVNNVKICSENGVKGYGIYEELPRERLASGKPARILIYCELENFRHEKTAEGKFNTRLQAQMTVYDSHYRPVAQRPPEEVRDVPSANPRRDFFLRGPLELPALAPGKYLLEVRMEDKVAGKIARPGLVEFEVSGAAPAASPPSLATTAIPKAN